VIKSPSSPTSTNPLPRSSSPDSKSLIIIYAIDYKRFNALSQGFIFRDGRPFQAPDEALADDIIAQTRHIKVVTSSLSPTIPSQSQASWPTARAPASSYLSKPARTSSALNITSL